MSGTIDRRGPGLLAFLSASVLELHNPVKLLRNVVVVHHIITSTITVEKETSPTPLGFKSDTYIHIGSYTFLNKLHS
jgi:hypothetical protein